MQKTNEDIWKKVLAKDEVLEKEFTISDRYIKISLITGIIIWGLLSLAGGIGIPFLLIHLFYFLFYIKKANAYAFTNKRVLIHKGWLSTNLVSIDYHKITDIFIKEPFLGRVIFNTGALAIDTAGTSSKEIILKNISEPYELKKILDELKDKAN